MATHGKLRTAAEYLPARLILGVLGLLPLSVGMAVGRLMGWLAYLFAGDLRRTGERNLQLAFPEKPAEERRQLLRGCFQSLGRALGLFTQFSSNSPETLQKMFDTKGLEHLERAEAQAKAQGKGIILFTAHLGAWELTSFGLSVIGHPFSFLVRRLDNSKLEELVDKSRTRFSNETLDKVAAARSMLKLLRAGKPLGLLLDLNTLDEEAIFIDFFGVPAATTFMVGKLALRTGSPIVPVFSPWDHARKKFLLQINEVVIPEPTGDEESDVRALTTRLSQIIENEIRRYPDQWLWIHKRWKTRPPGEPSIY
jgi:Kdo2-lipid IVA lauroyltransferase/acyltransferase